MSLLRLPYELLSIICEHLDLRDIYSLSFSCKRFQFLLYEPNITKLLLESKAPHSTEARDARISKRYAAGLRRLIKRREAVASVSPYLVAIVAFAEEWLYSNGVLCYLRGPQLRILDLHRSGSREMVVDTRKLFREALEGSRRRRTYQIQLLYQSHNIVSCVYGPSRRRKTRSPSSNWLVAFDPLDGQIKTVHRLESVSNLFVRNNERFLYYGTTSAPGHDGYERWVIGGFDLAAREWLGELTISAVIGTDIGSSVCFEILDGFLYVVSNQTSLELEVVDWISYYPCFRLPLTRRGLKEVEAPPREQNWRRNHTEGPIDDRFTFLRLFKDEETGQLRVTESRREWLWGRISARQTYYTTPISFEGADRDLRGRYSLQLQQQRTVSATRTRDPHLVHPADGNSATIPLSKSAVRSYHPSCQAFVDLVDDSNSCDTANQRIRIRGGSRRPRMPGERVERECLPAAQDSKYQDVLLRQIDDLYISENGLLWPPELDPSAPDPALSDLYAILNPPGYLGNLHGSWDERSMVYATGGTAGGLKALVFISWDPSISLAGTPPYPGKLSSGLLGSSRDKTRQTTERCPISQPNATSCPVGSFKPMKAATGGVQGGSAVDWRVFEPAGYREIGRGYHFAC